MTTLEKKKLFDKYLIPVERVEKMLEEKEKWNWKACIIPMKKGEEKENISINIDQILYA